MLTKLGADVVSTLSSLWHPCLASTTTGKYVCINWNESPAEIRMCWSMQVVRVWPSAQYLALSGVPLPLDTCCVGFPYLRPFWAQQCHDSPFLVTPGLWDILETVLTVHHAGFHQWLILGRGKLSAWSEEVGILRTPTSVGVCGHRCCCVVMKTRCLLSIHVFSSSHWSASVWGGSFLPHWLKPCRG